MKTAIAIAAHPDDIELMMAGTLLLLKNAGYRIHYMNLAGGNCGTNVYSSSEIRKMRLAEAKRAAKILGAHFHPPFCGDLEIVYDVKLLRRLAGVIREVKPKIVLTHSTDDYMEDHVNTCRLAVTASFARGMGNFVTVPAHPADNYDCTVYHALPHTLKDNFRRRVIPGSFVDTSLVHSTKLEALKQHKSQQNWLDVSQKMNSYLQTMEDVTLQVGEMSKQFRYAEGWRRHSHVGFCGAEDDPLTDLGKDYLINESYEKNLDLVQ